MDTSKSLAHAKAKAHRLVAREAQQHAHKAKLAKIAWKKYQQDKKGWPSDKSPV
jgi:hypothetical protein